MKQNAIQDTWTHSDLVRDLGMFFYTEKIVFLEVGIGPRRGGIPIPDVLTLNKSYVNPVPTIYEVKISQRDFKSDLRSDKWQRYLPYCQKFYFAAPTGMLKKSEIPEAAGLFVRGEGGWHGVKAPHTRNAEAWDQVDAMAVLMWGAFSGQEVRRLSARINMEENVELGHRAVNLGFRISRAINVLAKGEAVGSAGGKDILEEIAKKLELSVEALCELDGHEVRGKLINVERFEEELTLCKKAFDLLNRRWLHAKEDRGKLERQAGKLLRRKD